MHSKHRLGGNLVYGWTVYGAQCSKLWPNCSTGGGVYNVNSWILMLIITMFICNFL